MKAPDILYVHTGAHLGMLTLTIIPVDAPGEQEYIRKDALLEWLEECKNNPVITDLQKGNIQELVDKLNSM